MKNIAIITGGSSGIGLAIAENFLKNDTLAISWDLQAPQNQNVDFVKCDVSNVSSVLNAYEETLSKYGAATILINNAGLQHMSPVEDFPIEKWNQLIGVILTGSFLCSKAVIPNMKKMKYGRIINISSIHGKVASPYKAAYVAAKHGVIGLSKVMAQELGPFDITVNTICPGFVDTPLLQAQILKQADLNKISPEQVKTEVMLKPQVIKHFTSTQQIAEMVNFLCSESASTVTGEAYNMAGGWGMGT